jgi:hypothetical protein
MNNTLGGEYSCAFGFQSMYSGTQHKLSSAYGYQSLFSDTNGRYNTAVGGATLFYLNGGYYNTGLGYNAGSSYTSTEGSNVVINSPGVLGESNTLRIGQATGSGSQQLAQAFISGINGVTLGGTPKMVVIDSTTDQLAVQAIPLTTTPWTDEAVSFTASSKNGYFVSAAATATLPTSPSQGDSVTIAVDTSGTVVIQASAGQKIRLASGTSSTAGTATSTTIGSSLELIYRTATTEWFSISTEGAWILA